MEIRNMFGTSRSKITRQNTIEKKLNVAIATSGRMERAIELWSEMYENDPPWRRDGDAFNFEVIPLNLPAAISEEMARLTLTEFDIQLSGSARADYLNKQLHRNFINLSNHMELFCAKGGICLKPYVSGDNINIDFTQADRFYPTRYNSNAEITGAVFVDTVRQGDFVYTRLESHQLDGTDYTVINKAYKSEKLNNQLSDDDYIAVERPFDTAVPLSEVDEWKEISQEPVVINHVEQPLFVYVRVPRANNIDTYSPLGASVFSRAADVIEQSDIQFSRILWEYEATEAAVHASEDLFDTDRKGRPIMPKGRERLYRALDFNTAGKDGSFLETFAPTIRDNSLFAGLNKYFQRIEFLCGLSYGTISDPQQIEKTAEEIRQSKQRSFTVVSQIQSAWTEAFDRLIYSMDSFASLYGLTQAGQIDKSLQWGDGVLEDTDKEYQRRWAMVTAGTLRPEKFLEWYFGCSPEEAFAMMPEPVPFAFPPLE